MDMSNIPRIPRLGRCTKFLAFVAGADVDLLAQSPKRDLDAVCSVGALMCAAALYQAALLMLISSRLFAAPGPVNPFILAVSLFIPLFILKVDRYTIMMSGWHLAGIAELKRGGLDIAGGISARVKAGCMTVVRLLLAGGVAQLSAVGGCDLIFLKDIAAQIERDNLHANALLVKAVTERFDDGAQRQRDSIKSLTDAIAKARAQVYALRQRRNELASSEPRLQDAQAEVAQLMATKTKADDEAQEAETFALNEAAGIKDRPNNSGQIGEGVSYHAARERADNAKAHSIEAATALDAARGRIETLSKEFKDRTDTERRQIDEQVASIESSTTKDSAQLADLNDRLEQYVQGREAAIQSAVIKSQDYVPKRDGLLIQIAALRTIADESPEVAIVILLIELVSFGFELAAVLAKVTSFVPTTYAALLARDAYMSSVNIVDEMARELDGRTGDVQRDEEAPTIEMPAANDNEPTSSASSPILPQNEVGDEPPPPPPKRPRGRPRKNPAA